MIDDDRELRNFRKNQFCPECRVAIVTFFVEEMQKDRSWKTVKITRNCGHQLPTDPQFN